MTNTELLDLLALQKKYSDCLSDLAKMHKNLDNEDNMHFTNDQLLTAIFVLGRISKEYGRKIDDIIF